MTVFDHCIKSLLSLHMFRLHDRRKEVRVLPILVTSHFKLGGINHWQGFRDNGARFLCKQSSLFWWHNNLGVMKRDKES